MALGQSLLTVEMQKRERDHKETARLLQSTTTCPRGGIRWIWGSRDIVGVVFYRSVTAVV